MIEIFRFEHIYAHTAYKANVCITGNKRSISEREFWGQTPKSWRVRNRSVLLNSGFRCQSPKLVLMHPHHREKIDDRHGAGIGKGVGEHGRAQPVLLPGELPPDPCDRDEGAQGEQ